MYFLFNYMITKIDDCDIKHQLNTEMVFFFYHDNLIKGETKLIMKPNSQLTQYLRMEKKTNLKKLNLSDPQTKLTNQTCK
jgi:hypothetical protein